MTVASTTEIATPTVELLLQVTIMDHLTVGDQMPLPVPSVQKTLIVIYITENVSVTISGQEINA